MIDNKMLFTMGEAAFPLRRAEATLRRWRMEGLYPDLFRKIGGKVLIHADDLQRMIDGKLPRGGKKK